jgi:hypothetical protein
MRISCTIIQLCYKGLTSRDSISLKLILKTIAHFTTEEELNRLLFWTKEQERDSGRNATAKYPLSGRQKERDWSKGTHGRLPRQESGEQQGDRYHEMPWKNKCHRTDHLCLLSRPNKMVDLFNVI